MGSSDLLGLTISLMSSTLVIALAAALMPRIVGDKPNSVVGIRTKATMSSPAAWKLSHRVARPLLRRTVWTAVAGLSIQVIIGIVAGFGSVATAVAAPAALLAVLIALIYAAIKGNAAAKWIRC